jgi:hypothetical protein
MGVSSSGTPLQGASSSSKPVEEGDLQQVALEVGKLHLTKTRLSGSAWRKLKKAGESQGGTGGQQQPRHVASPKPKEAQTKVPNWPRSEGSTPIKEANSSKRPRDLLGSLDKCQDCHPHG